MNFSDHSFTTAELGYWLALISEYLYHRHLIPLPFVGTSAAYIHTYVRVHSFIHSFSLYLFLSLSSLAFVSVGFPVLQSYR